MASVNNGILLCTKCANRHIMSLNKEESEIIGLDEKGWTKKYMWKL